MLHDLFGFFMQSVFFAPPAMLLELQTIFECFFILRRIIVHSFAFFAFQFDEIILAHIFIFLVFYIFKLSRCADLNRGPAPSFAPLFI